MILNDEQLAALVPVKHEMRWTDFLETIADLKHQLAALEITVNADADRIMGLSHIPLHLRHDVVRNIQRPVTGRAALDAYVQERVRQAQGHTSFCVTIREHERIVQEKMADLQRQLAEYEEAAATAMRILLEGRPGAAQNAVREDYPEMARILDNYVDAKTADLQRQLAGPPTRAEMQAKIDALEKELADNDRYANAIVTRTDADIERRIAEARQEGWTHCLDLVRVSIKDYPDNSGDIEIMAAIEGIVAEAVLAEHDETCRDKKTNSKIDSRSVD